MTLRYPDLASVKKEIETELNAYIHAIIVLSSLREYLQNMKIECYIEKRIKKKEGEHKTPDLLIHSDNYLIVDHKYTESKDQRTLANKVEEMKEYDTIFVLPNSKSKIEIEFKPECVMLTPNEAVSFFKKILDCPVTWGYTLNEEIVVEQGIGSVEDSRILSLFNPTVLCPRAEEVSKYKFIISHAPLPYTACQVYIVLWNLSPPTQFFTPEFEVKYDDILDGFNHLFPPWISPEIKQLNTSRLSGALLFLQVTGWIRWLETEKKVIVDRKKGRFIADSLSYLVDHYVKMEHTKRVKEYEKKVKELKIEKRGKQEQISTYF